jgi:parallel beta helix pectate lyase-like protein
LTHKKVNNADAGTSVKFGGNDLDKWSDYASGVDTDDYDINADTQYRYDKFQIRNSANTFGHKHRSLATAARTFTYPDADITIDTHQPYKYYIYLDSVDNKFKAKNGGTGTIDYTSSDNTDAQPVIQNAINASSNAPGIIQLAGNTTFPLVTVATNRHITMRSGTVLRGAGYSSYLKGTVGMIIVYLNTVDNCVIENLRIDAQNTNGETGTENTFGSILTTAAVPNFCNNIWVNRVWSYNAVGSHIKLKRCKVGYVTNCYTEVSGLDAGSGPGGIIASDGGESVNFIGNICKNTGAEAFGIFSPAEDHYRANIIGNISYITTDSPITDTGRIGVAEKGRGHILIENEGPPTDNYGTYINIANNVLHTTYYGISLQSGKFVHIHDNIIYNTGFTAQALSGINISGAGGNDIDVHDNIIHDVAEQGIRVAAESTRLKIHDNQIINCGSKTANTYDGIYHNTSSGFASNTIDIYNNTMTDTRGASKMMRDGLRMETSGTGTTTNVFLRDNFSTGHTGLAENIVSAVVTFRERLGTATAVTDGSTVTHKLSATPTWITATGTVAGEIVTVPTVGSTTFTVSIKKWTGGTLTAGTSQTIYWRALIAS